jgi:hypothetical protein
MRQIPACLRDFITAGTVAQCELVPSISGLYYTDIVGVTGSMLANMANEEDTTIGLLSERILARALLRFRELLNGAMFNAGYALREGYIKSKNVCKFEASTIAAAAAFRGLSIEKPATGLPAYTAYFINSLQLRATQSGTTIVEIRDADGVVLWSKPVTVTANTTLHLPVQKEFADDLFYVVWDTSALDTYAVSCTAPSAGCTPCHVPCNKSITDRYIIKGWDGLQATNDKYGIIIEGGAQCSFDAFLCANASYFSSAILALCEAEIFSALQRSSRLNYDTIYQDPSTVSGIIEKAKNTANKRIKEQLSVLLPTMQKNAPYCLTCNTQTSAQISVM